MQTSSSWQARRASQQLGDHTSHSPQVSQRPAALAGVSPMRKPCKACERQIACVYDDNIYSVLQYLWKGCDSRNTQ